MRLVDEELALEGDPARNLATFVTTWMEPEAQRLIAENLHRNFIDHAEYPISAEIEQRCVRMLADLFNAPGETTGARTQGSSEAIMLGALSLKWKWRKRREAAGKPIDTPNLVFGGDVHVVWEKFCRYFDVEPRIVPLQEGKYTIGPEDVEPHIDENTIGVAAVLGTTFTGHGDDIVGINDLLVRTQGREGARHAAPRRRRQRRLRLAVPLPRTRSGTSGSSRCARSTSPATSSGSSTRASAGSSSARRTTSPRTSSSTRTTSARPTRPSPSTSRPAPRWCSPSTTTSSASAARATPTSWDRCRRTPATLAEKLEAQGDFELIDADEEQLPLVAFKLADGKNYDEFDVSWQLSAERGWMLPAYTLPPERRRREGDAGAGQGDAEPRADRPPRGRHPRGLRDAREEGRR